MDDESLSVEVKERIDGMVQLCREAVGQPPDWPEWLPLLPDGRIDWVTFERRAARRGIAESEFWESTPAGIQLRIEGADRRDKELAAAIARQLQPADPADDLGVELPKYEARLEKWKKVWKHIKPYVQQDHLTPAEIATKIKKTKSLKDKLRDCPQHRDTLYKIIEAGKADLL